MKKIIFILLSFTALQSKSQLISLVVRNDTVFGFNPSTAEYTQYTKLVPSMAGQSGKVLSNNGTNYTWITNSASVSWGGITGTLADQTDLQATLNLKANLASPSFTGTPTGIGIPVYAQVTGSNATTTGQALVDITGLSVALTTNATYEFEAVLMCQTSAVTTGTAYGVNYSAAGAAVEALITGSSTSTASKTLRISTLNSATALYLASSGQTGGILIKGRVTTGANAGNLTIQHLKLTSGTSTVFIGSFLKVTRIN